MTQKSALRINNLSFKFSHNKPFFFKDLSVDFPAGNIHFIRGKNGMGKSLFFRLIQGKFLQDEVISGSFVTPNQTIMLGSGNPLPVAYTSCISTVSQKFDQMLADMFSFSENLRLANLPENPGLLPLPAHKPLPDFLKQFSIDLNKPVRLLSGGQRQILAIIMALQKAGTILLLDEPTAALDEQNALLVMKFLDNLVRSLGITVLIISHDNDLVAEYAHDGYYEIILKQETGIRKIVKS